MKQLLIKTIQYSILSTAILVGVSRFNRESLFIAKKENNNSLADLNSIEHSKNVDLIEPQQEYHNFEVQDHSFQNKKLKHNKTILNGQTEIVSDVSNSILKREKIKDNNRYLASESNKQNDFKTSNDEISRNKKNASDSKSDENENDISDENNLENVDIENVSANESNINPENSNLSSTITIPISTNTNKPTTSDTSVTNDIATNVNISEPRISPTLQPKVKGIVYPLKNIALTNNNTFKIPELLIRSSFANTCSAIAAIHEIDNTTFIPEIIPILTSAIKPDATFELNIDEKIIDTTTPNKYLLKISGCNSSFSRIITSFYSEQDVSIDTTLLSKVLEVHTAKKITEADLTKLAQISHRIDHKSDNFEEAYVKLSTNVVSSNEFKAAFGSDISVLTTTKPSITNENISVIINENTNNPFVLSTQHWYSQYDIVQEWYLNNSFQMSGQNFTFSPNANNQGLHTLKTLIGRNDGNGHIDTNLPYEEKIWNITVIDTIPALAPIFNLHASNPAPVLANSFDLSLITGVNFGNCETFSTMAITETPMVPPSNLFNLTCTTQGNQTENYALLNLTDGAKTLYLWAKDSSGQISASPSILNFRKDTTQPSATLTNILGVVAGNSNQIVSFSAHDDNEISNINLSYSLNGGATYTSITNLSSGSTSYNWTIPSLDSTNVTLRLRVTDGAGKIFDVNTADFAIDSTAPLAPAAILASPSISNSTGVSITVTDCSNTDFILVNNGSLPASSDPNWIACNTTAAHYSYTLSNVEATQSFAVWGKDISGNISASTTLNVTYDITAATATIASLPATVKGGDSYGLTFSRSDLNGIQSTALSYTLDGTNFINIASNPVSPYSWNIPVTDTSNLKLKLVVTDNAGNIQTVTSDTSIIDSTPPTAHNISIATSLITNSTSVLLTSTSCTDTSFVLINEGTQPTSSDSNWQACSTTVGAITHTITAVEGVRTLKAWFKDAVGNVSTGHTTSNLTFDTTPPTQSLNNLASSLRGGDNVNLVFTQSDSNGINSSKLQYSSDGTNFVDIISNPTSPYLWNIPLHDTISAKIRLITIDNATNIATITTSGFSIDSTTPNSPVLTRTSAAITNNTIVTFTATNCTDTPQVLFNEGSQPTRTDPNWTNCTTVANALTYSIVATEGTHTIKAWSKDAVGNVSSLSSNFNIIYDVTLPNNSLNNLASLLKGSSTINITFTESDLNGLQSNKLQYASDGVTFADIVTSASSPYTWTIPAHNTSNAKIRFISTDMAGNSNSKTSSTFTIDSTPPIITISNLPTSIRGGIAQNITFTQSDLNGVLNNKLQYAVDGINFVDIVSNATSPYSWNIPTHNTSAAKIKLIATDNAGNVSSTETIAFTIDSTAPNAPLLSLTSTSIRNNIGNTFTASSCTDTPFILFNESTQPTATDPNWVSCTTVANALNFNIGAIEGAHTIKAWSKDAVGNVSSSSTNFSVIYDITNPTNSLTNLASLIRGSTSQAITFTQSDLNGISSHKLQYSSDGTNFADIVTSPISPYSWTVPAHNTSSAYIRLITTDNAGNSSTKTSTVFTIDSLAPNAPVANLYSPLISSSTAIGVTVTDCLDRPNVFISESMIAPAPTDSGWLTCNTTAGGLSYTLTGPTPQGSKTIYVYAKDAAGNVSPSTSFNMTYDTVNPTVNLSTVLSGTYKGGDTIPLSFSASDANGLNVFRLEYASDGVNFSTVANFSASTTNYTWTIPTDNTVSAKIRILVHDNAVAANINNATSATFAIDSTPPSEVLATLHSSYYTSSTSVALTISSCSDRPYILINEGSQPLSTDAGWVTCSTVAGALTYTIASTQGIHNIKIWAKDAVGNVTTTSPSIPMVFDNVLPTINVLSVSNVRGNQSIPITFSVTEQNISSAQNLLVEYHNGGSWSSWNIQANNGPLSNYNYTTNITTPNSENTLLTFRVSYTDLAGNYRQTSVQFRTDLVPPTVNSLSINSGALSTTNNNIQIALSASDNLSKVTQFCLKYNDTSAPVASSSCWVDVNAPSPGVTPSTNISFTGFYYQIGFAKGTYTVYGWAKDESGQVSSNAAILNVDMASITFDPGTVPVISKAVATNTDAPGIPIDATDLSAPNGSDIYIKWHAADIEGLDANPINIQYTTNDSTFIDLSGGQNLANAQNGSCTIDGSLTGCVKLQAPSSTYFKLRIIAKDTLGTTVFFNTVPLNEGKLKILAGNTEHGLNGSARSAVFYTYNAYQSNGYGAKYKLVVSDNGNFFYLDPQRGLLWVEPTTGALKSFIATTGTSTGDDGPVNTATLRSPNAITLDHYNNLLIWDYNIIRKVNLDTMTITKLIGGGATANPSVTIPASNMQLPNGFNQTWGTLIPFPNGDLIFSNTGTTLHYRYRAADQNVERIEIQGTGVYGYPSDSWSTLGKTDLAIAYNTTNSQIQFMIQGMFKSFTGDSYAIPAVVDHTSGNENTPYSANGPHNTAWNYRNYNVGLNGRIYIHTRYRADLHVYDHTTNTLTRVLGTGSESPVPCADDTVSTSCAMGLDSVFISKTGRMYFIDNGLLRTVDDSNKVITLFGQFPSYGDGVLATAARFGNIIDINLGKTLPSNDKIIIQDGYSNLFREITFDSNIQNLTGACYSWHGPWTFEVDSTDGDILSSCGTSFRRFDRDTASWNNVIGGGGTNYYLPTAVGKTGAEINMVSSYNTNTNGLINGKLIYQKYYWSAGVHYGCSIRTYDINDSYRVGEFMSNANADCAGGITTGIDMTSHPVAETNFGKFRTFVDPSDAQSKYFFSTVGNNTIYKSQNLGVINSFITLNHNTNSFTHAIQADGLNIYYCATNGYLYKYNYNSAITTNLSWNSPTLRCKATRNIIHHPTRNSLIFPISQNGLNGVAEYDLN